MPKRRAAVSKRMCLDVANFVEKKVEAEDEDTIQKVTAWLSKNTDLPKSVLLA